MNKCVFGILCNDGSSKIRTGKGTQYYLKANINNIDYYKEWSIFDEINNTQLYKEVCDIRTLYLSNKDLLKNELETKLLVEKENKLQERKESVVFSEASLDIIKSSLLEYSVLVDQYRNGNEKSFNSLVGKILSNFKKLNIKEDPFNISVILKTLL